MIRSWTGGRSWGGCWCWRARPTSRPVSAAGRRQRAVVAGTGPTGPLGPPTPTASSCPPGSPAGVVAPRGQAGRRAPATSGTRPRRRRVLRRSPAAAGSTCRTPRTVAAPAASSASGSTPTATSSTRIAILTGTSRNCAGGPTPWGTWLSCEENGTSARSGSATRSSAGQGVAAPAARHVQPRGCRRRPVDGHVYLTEDDSDGRLYRFTPTSPGDLSAGLAARPPTSSGRRHLGARVHHRPRTVAPPRPLQRRRGRVVRATARCTSPPRATTGCGSSTPSTDQLTRALRRLDQPALRSTASTTSPCTIRPATSSWPRTAATWSCASSPPPTRSRWPRSCARRPAGSEITGPAFSPDGTRLYFSSQRGTDGPRRHLRDQWTVPHHRWTAAASAADDDGGGGSVRSHGERWLGFCGWWVGCGPRTRRRRTSR